MKLSQTETEFTKEQLDLKVAQCLIKNNNIKITIVSGVLYYFGMFGNLREFKPSSDWDVAGPIIENIEGLNIKSWLKGSKRTKYEIHINNNDGNFVEFGSNLLETIMLCYVSSKS